MKLKSELKEGIKAIAIMMAALFIAMAIRAAIWMPQIF